MFCGELCLGFFRRRQSDENAAEQDESPSVTWDQDGHRRLFLLPVEKDRRVYYNNNQRKDNDTEEDAA